MIAALVFLLSVTASGTPPPTPGWLGLGYTYHETRGPAGRVVWLFVQQIVPAGPAEKAGLKPQDVITGINGKPLPFRGEIDALNYFSGVKPGERFEFEVRRGATRRTLTVVAVHAPPNIAQVRRNNQILAKAHRATP